MFRYCPSCASQNIRFGENKKVYCPDCGLVYYHNTAAATAGIISTGAGAVLLVRAKEPAKGKLDLPGGFVDPGEGALEGLIRECREELGWDPPAAYPAGRFSFFGSYPNVYPYKGFRYNTCDLVFTFDAPDLTAADFRLQREEVAAVRFIRAADLDYSEIAFDSARQALRSWAALQGGASPA
jgi:8-oxo-dGTP pyrophosphatase MutT (NUDIX family)